MASWITRLITLGIGLQIELHIIDTFRQKYFGYIFKIKGFVPMTNSWVIIKQFQCYCILLLSALRNLLLQPSTLITFMRFKIFFFLN
jgi:hypothetical protein